MVRCWVKIRSAGNGWWIMHLLAHLLPFYKQLSTASKKRDEVNIYQFLWFKSNFLFHINELVELGNIVEVVCQNDLTPILNHTMTGKGLYGKNFFIWVFLCVFFYSPQVTVISIQRRFQTHRQVASMSTLPLCSIKVLIEEVVSQLFEP